MLFVHLFHPSTHQYKESRLLLGLYHEPSDCMLCYPLFDLRKALLLIGARRPLSSLSADCALLETWMRLLYDAC